MRIFLTFLLPLLLLTACAGSVTDPYAPTLCRLEVSLDYPDGMESCEGVAVQAEDINLGSRYSAPTDAAGKAAFSLPAGLYRFSVSEIRDEDIFNGLQDNFPVKASTQLSLPLGHSRTGKLVFKEIYSGGCKKDPQEGTYQSDKYLIIHNNFHEVQYLDGLCVGTIFPYNATANNPFLTFNPATYTLDLPDFLPIAQAVWQFGGDGTSFPLEPGADAVVCLCGAINHAAEYPLSVNLDKEDYFVCYNPTFFYNTVYHPAPGPHIRQERYLDCLMKLGQANAYTFSVNSPTAVLYHAPEGMTMSEYLRTKDAVVQVPGSSYDKTVVIRPEWVVDAVEVFNGASSSNAKRLQPSLDAGYVSLSGTYLGRSLMRRTNEELSALVGYEVLTDTNNSSFDFYERETQSLHE